MADGSLFDSEAKSGSGKTMFLIGLAALLLVGGIAYGMYWYSSPVPPDPKDLLANEIRENTVFLLAQPSFSGQEFREQILGKGRLEKYAWQEKDAYFTYPEVDDAEFQQFLTDNFHDVSKIDFGKMEGGRIAIDSYKLRPSPTANKFFKTKTENFKLKTDREVSFPYSTVNYTISLNEIRQLSNNTNVYGGKMITQASARSDEPQYFFANHAIMVAKPDEPSLKRLVEALLKDVGDNREGRIQRLVDFVSTEIEYSYTEATSSREKLKRPNETLMTRSADCSNKTILLASLLEQINEDYLMIYSPQHITIAVPQGAFPNENGLDFKWDQKPWMIAETTAAGFQVGLSQIAEPWRLTKVEYVQNPKNPDVIFDADSFAVLKFL